MRFVASQSLGGSPFQSFPRRKIYAKTYEDFWSTYTRSGPLTGVVDTASENDCLGAEPGHRGEGGSDGPVKKPLIRIVSSKLPFQWRRDVPHVIKRILYPRISIAVGLVGGSEHGSSSGL